MLQVPDQKVPLTADKEGVLYVTGTGVDLHAIVGMFEEGASAEEIAHEYDALNLPDVYAVIAYYLSHRDDVNAMLADEERRSERRAENYEKRLPEGLRQKLLDSGRPRGG